jgi:hypothetical protein
LDSKRWIRELGLVDHQPEIRPSEPMAKSSWCNYFPSTLIIKAITSGGCIITFFDRALSFSLRL